MSRSLKIIDPKDKYFKIKPYIPSIIFALSAFFLLIFALVIFFSPGKKETIQIIPSETKESTDSGIMVDLSGAVNKPGLYHLPAESRVNDLIKKAGGFSDSADQEYIGKSINLAQKLTDGIKINIPSLDDVDNIDGFVAGTSSRKVNINLATASELDTLPSIGPSTAEEIIKYRQEHGNFSKPEDIVKVSGIGEKTYEKLKDSISVY